MPNWCSNYLVFSCPKEQYDKYNMGSFQFSNFLKCPAELGEQRSPNRVNAEEMQKKYGHPDWYAWCVSNWGTKWEIDPVTPSLDDSSSPEVVSGSVCFDTAWSPPIELYRFMETLGFAIDASFYEGGLSFYGYYNDGNENTTSFSSHLDIPEDVVTTFGLVDDCEVELQENSDA